MEKKNREIAKLEKNTGKKFLEVFDLGDKSIEEIYLFIESLKGLSAESVSGVSNEKSTE